MLTTDTKYEVKYCIPLWLRDEQIKHAVERIKGRVEPCKEIKAEPIAVVGYGPSLNDTWEKIRDFKYVMTCSGAHKFLLDRGIVPTWHVEVDPRPHKIKLIGEPHPDTEYLISATCHPAVFDHLEGHKVKLWHVFSNETDVMRLMPPGEWAITGGCNVGLRCMTIARFMGFTQQHLFGIDGSGTPEAPHAAGHPNKYPLEACEYEGQTYYTTVAFLEAAKQTFHELNQMPDVQCTFHGAGLVQDMAKSYVPKPIPKEKAIIGYAKPELISAEYVQLNRQLHRDNLAYGVGGERHAKMVMQIREKSGLESVLDYGCGKSYLAKALPFPIWEYDPAIPGKEASPRPADLVVCTSVLEHVEPDKLPMVLNDLGRCVKKVGYFAIGLGPAKKKLADGRNAHLIQEKPEWWGNVLASFFKVGKLIHTKPELIAVVGPR